jgi:DNA-directed RNA polymerase subunit RPC12/RpoP
MGGGCKMKCKQCGKRIRVNDNYNPTSYDKYEFCSQKCSKKWVKEHTEKKNCLKCGHEFETTQPRKEWYCKKCRNMINEEKIDNNTISHPLLD